MTDDHHPKDPQDSPLARRIDEQKRNLDAAHEAVLQRLRDLAATDQSVAPPPADTGDTPDTRVLQLEEDNEALRVSLHEARERIADLEEQLAVAEAERNQLQREAEQRAMHAPAPPVPTTQTLPAQQHSGPPVQVDAFDDRGHKRRMGDILVGFGVISEEELDEALSQKANQPHQRLGEILVTLGFTNEDVIATILAAQLRVPFVKLDEMDIDPADARLLPANLARRHLAIVIRNDVAKVTVAMANPLDLIAIEDIEIATRSRVEPVIATPTAVRNALQSIYGTA
jgi:hypothetical protein